MIIGKRFIWMHFPKCAGTFTENLLKLHFESDPDILFDKIDPTQVIWHQNIAQRERRMQTDLSAKEVICNFRRLPSWIISRVNYESVRSGYTATRDMYTRGRFFDNAGAESYADRTLEKFTEREVNYWIRVEFLYQDFFQTFSRFLNVNEKIGKEEFQRVVNSTGTHAKPVFSMEELQVLYDSNPGWANLERKLYGNLQSEI